MPTISSSIVPPPKSWDEFEDITLSASKLRWGSAGFSRYGRTGQAQDGVDVYGHDGEDRLIGVQCKNTVSGVTIGVVKDEVAKAEKFEPTLDWLFIATTAPRDAALQKEVRFLSADRHKSKKFRVDILFWDDVCSDLAKDEEVFFGHYPQFRSKPDDARAHDKALYDQLLKLLRSDGVIGFLDETNMAGFSFPRAKFDPLHEFRYEWNRPEREFLTPELEVLRKALWEKVSEYSKLLEAETFPTDNNPDWSWVPPDWEYQNPEHFSKVVAAFHNLASDIVDLHAEFVRTGKARLIAG